MKNDVSGAALLLAVCCFLLSLNLIKTRRMLNANQKKIDLIEQMLDENQQMIDSTQYKINALKEMLNDT